MAASPKKKFEPFFDTTNQNMIIGGLVIPPTSLLTSLLYGFANHDDIAAQEYYFWRICDEIWNHPDMPEPLMVKHPWAEEMIWEALNNKYLSVGGAASSGKCLGPEVLVRMADGTCKRADEIKKGDKLVGDDGKTRTVTGTRTGRSNMVRIAPRKGDAWTCNDDHILSLRKTSGELPDNLADRIIDIPVKEYLAQSGKFKERFHLYKACAQFPAQPVPVEPRLYGLWLADGDSKRPVITCAEEEVECTEYLQTCWPDITRYQYSEGKTPGFRYRKHPEFIALTKTSTATGEKRLDPRYLQNDEETRLHVLAGILDGDGHLVSNGVSFTLSQAKRGLIEDVKDLAHSLGFTVSRIKTIQTTCPRKDGSYAFGQAHVIRISGDTERIPTLRKKCRARLRFTSGEESFKIEQLGEGEWAGFAVDGNHRFLLADGTVTHNSHVFAAYGIAKWISSPQDTLVLMTSTTLREARKRIWGSVVSLLSVIDGLPGRIRDSIGNVAYINEGGTLIERAGLSLIAAEKSKTREAVGKFIGIKQKNVIVIADELSELSEAILHAGLSNLSKNPNFQMIGLSNPNSRFDAFGSWSTPKDGWDSVDAQTADNWDTKWGGRYIRLDGERSPNVLAGEVIYPWLPTEEKLAEDRELLGEESRGYMRMVRAVFFDSDEAEGVYSASELVATGAMNKAEWVSKPITIAGLDPAFTNGGDRTILYTANVGYTTNGQYAFEFGDYYSLNDDATNKAVPRTYQIVHQVKKLCEKLKIAPENLAVDATGAGAPFCDVLAGEWSNSFTRVTFGGTASDKRVSANSKLIGSELYYNRVSELWFVGKELMRTKQIFGVSQDLAQELTARNYDMVKSTSLRMKLESKPEFKARFGRSPDLADAAFIALDLARQVHGVIAMEPREESNAENMRRMPPRSFKALRDAHINLEGQLVD